MNPHLVHARAEGRAQPPLALAQLIEARDPRVQAYLHPAGARARRRSLRLRGQSQTGNPTTGKLFTPGYNQVFIDPATGRELEPARVWAPGLAGDPLRTSSRFLHPSCTTACTSRPYGASIAGASG
ncbi:hypothetical protein ACRAWD_25340 [Caulobacter segnis]